MAKKGQNDASDIFDQLCALWPYPKLSIQAKHRASLEMDFVVDKQWEKWLKHHASIGLPQEYVDSGPNSKSAFIIPSKSQLTEHLTAGTHTILLAQQHFDTYSHTVMENLRGQRLPKRKRK